MSKFTKITSYLIDSGIKESEIEDHLEKCLCSHYGNIGVVWRQKTLPCGRLDLLIRDFNLSSWPKDGSIVRFYWVIELKRDIIDSKTLTQALRYTTYLKKHYGEKTTVCNGTKRKIKRIFMPLLIGSKISDDLLYAVPHKEKYFDIVGETYEPCAYHDLFEVTLEEGLSLGWHRTISDVDIFWERRISGEPF